MPLCPPLHSQAVLDVNGSSAVSEPELRKMAEEYSKVCVCMCVRVCVCVCGRERECVSMCV